MGELSSSDAEGLDESIELDSSTCSSVMSIMEEKSQVECGDGNELKKEILDSSDSEVSGYILPGVSPVADLCNRTSEKNILGELSSSDAEGLDESIDLDSSTCSSVITIIEEKSQVECGDGNELTKDILESRDSEVSGIISRGSAEKTTDTDSHSSDDSDDDEASGVGYNCSDPMVIEMQEESDYWDNESQSSNDNSDISVVEISSSDSHSTQVKELTHGETAHVGKKAEPRLVTSLTPLDDVYIRSAAENTNGDLHFSDTLGDRRTTDEDSSASDSVSIEDLEDSESDNANQHQSYRDCSSDASSSDHSSCNSDSDAESEVEEIFRSGPRFIKHHEVTSHGELTCKDLPPIEDLHISVPEEECLKVGIVYNIVKELVVVQALPNTPALDLGTVLFMNSGRDSLGEIFDVFGQVKEPHYAIRFNSEEHARSRGVDKGVEVYCAPRTKYTSYVFVYEMLKMKGSDASWEHNNEPPSHCLDYSDDEQERMARRRKSVLPKNRERKNRVNDNEVDLVVLDSDEESLEKTVPEGLDGADERGPSASVPSMSANANRNFGSDRPFAHAHWRKVLPNGTPPCPSTESANMPSNPCLQASASPVCHPPGHPPVKTFQSTEWMECNLALKAARRISRHLYHNLPSSGLLPTPTDHTPNPPTSTFPPHTLSTHALRTNNASSETLPANVLSTNTIRTTIHPSSQNVRFSLLPTPEHQQQRHGPRPPLLQCPPKNSWITTPRPVFLITRGMSGGEPRFRFNSPDPNRAHLLCDPSPPSSMPNFGGPSNPVSVPLISGNMYQSYTPQSAPIITMSSRGTTYTPQSYSSRPQYLATWNNNRPFMLRPSSLYPRAPRSSEAFEQ